MKVKEESEKVGLKLNIQKTKIMASVPITSREIEGKKVEMWQILSSWAPKSLQRMTAAMKKKKKKLAPWKKSYDKPRKHIKKERHYFANKGPSSQSYGFSSSHIQIWEMVSKKGWAPKNWCFWTVVLEKTLESLLDFKEIQPVHPKGNPEYSLKGLMLKLNTLATWFKELTHLKRPWCWERLRAGEGDDRGWDGLVGITDSTDMSFSKLWEIVKDREAWRATVHGVTKSQTRLSDWTTANRNVRWSRV